MSARTIDRRHVCAAAAIAVALLSARPAAAQVSGAAPAPAPSTGRVLFGGEAGVSAVENIGALVGGELGYHVTNQLDVLGEGFWMQDVVTRRRLDSAASVAAFLHGTQGAAASSTIKAPAFYAGGGLRYMLKSEGRVRPYLLVSAGAGWITLKPAFTLGGSNVTSTLPQYGVTLGSDLTGKLTEPAVSARFGVRMSQTRTYVDGGIRVTTIWTPNQATNVVSASAGFGFRF